MAGSAGPLGSGTPVVAARLVGQQIRLPMDAACRRTSEPNPNPLSAPTASCLAPHGRREGDSMPASQQWESFSLRLGQPPPNFASFRHLLPCLLASGFFKDTMLFVPDIL